MRRKDRQITDEIKIEEIISSCHCCRLGLNDNGQVYIVPMNFGYERIDETYFFYFHCAKAGRKTDLIKQNPNVGFELDTNYKLNTGNLACDYSARFQSVIGSGTVEFINDTEQKKYALTKIMEHYTHNSNWTYSDAMLRAVCILKLSVNEFSCKEHL